MKRIIIYFTVLTAVLSLSFCSVNPEDALKFVLSMPKKISVYIPAALKKGADPSLRPLSGPITNETGWAIETLKDFTAIGVSATELVDMVLSNVNAYSNFFATNKGTLVKDIDPAGLWVYYADQPSGGQYLWYGDTAATTNMYIDWVSNGSGFSGSAKYFVLTIYTNSDIIEATFYFDTSTGEVDVYLKPNYSNTAPAWWEDLRILMKSYSSTAVTVQAKGILTNAYTNDTSIVDWQGRFKNWDLVGYSDSASDGGVIAWATSYLTDVETNEIVTNSSLVADYAYEEYFNASGELLWKVGVFTSVDFTGAYTNDANTTNNAKPTSAYDILTNVQKLTDATYPTLTTY